MPPSRQQKISITEETVSKVGRMKHSVQRTHRRTGDLAGGQDKSFIFSRLQVVPRLAAASPDGTIAGINFDLFLWTSLRPTGLQLIAFAKNYVRHFANCDFFRKFAQNY